MDAHYWKKLDGFPVAFVIVFSVGIFLPLLIALSYGHVTPYVPYISEGGGLFPEAGVFSLLVSISCILCQWIMCLRYLLVEQLISKSTVYLNTFFNKISFVLGVISTIAMLIVTSFPTTSISQVHNSAVGVACVCYNMYLIFQSVVSYRILGKTHITNWRIAITVLGFVAIVFVAVFGALGSTTWTQWYWPGKKTPKDKGFAYYVVSATAEWILAVLLMLYFTTFIPEFKKATFKYQLEIDGDQQINPPRLANLDIRHRHP